MMNKTANPAKQNNNQPQGDSPGLTTYNTANNNPSSTANAVRLINRFSDHQPPGASPGFVTRETTTCRSTAANAVRLILWRNHYGFH